MTDLPNLEAAITWLHPKWTARLATIPTRLHVHAVEPDSVLGSPKLSHAFLAHLAASAHDVVLIVESRDCHHHRLAQGFDVWACPDCSGAGRYEAERAYYRDPLASALDSLRRRPGTWPRGLLPPHRLVLELVARRYRVPALAADLGLRADVCAEFARLAIARLASRYREAPPTRVGWVDKSAAQQAAETAA